MKPVAGDTIRVFAGQFGDGLSDPSKEHICTVRDTLSTQFTAVYEYSRPDGGWNERTLFVKYSDSEWNVSAQEWRGVAS